MGMCKKYTRIEIQQIQCIYSYIRAKGPISSLIHFNPISGEGELPRPTSPCVRTGSTTDYSPVAAVLEKLTFPVFLKGKDLSPPDVFMTNSPAMP